MEKVIESSADAVVAADMKGTILIFNSVAERITGYRRAPMVLAAAAPLPKPPKLVSTLTCE